MIGGPCLVSSASFARARRSFGFALPSPPFRAPGRPARRPRRPRREPAGTGPRCRPLRPTGVGDAGLAAAAAALEAKAVVRAGRVRHPGCGARSPSGCDAGGVESRRAAWLGLPESPTGGGVAGVPRSARARGRPCCPCRRRQSARGSRCPCRACRSRCRCRCSRSERDRARASVAGVVLVRRLCGLLGLRRVPLASAAVAPAVAVAVAVPVVVVCRSRCPEAAGLATSWAALLLPPVQPSLVLLGLGACDRPGAARQEHDSDRAENGKGRQRAGCKCPRLVRKRVEGGHVFYFGRIRLELERSLKTVSNVRPSRWPGRRSAQALPLLSVQSYPGVRVFANHW